MLQKTVAFVAALVLFASAATVQADEPNGQLSNDALAQFGLAGVERVSDDAGEEIRGKFIINPDGAFYAGLVASIEARELPPTIEAALILEVDVAIANLNATAVQALADFSAGLDGLTITVDPGFYLVD